MKEKFDKEYYRRFYFDARTAVVSRVEMKARLFEVGPEVMVPGSKMPLQRLPNAQDRADLIAYLKQITAPDRRE